MISFFLVGLFLAYAYTFIRIFEPFTKLCGPKVSLSRNFLPQNVSQFFFSSILFFFFFLLFFFQNHKKLNMAANFSPEIMAKIKEVTAKNYAQQAQFYLNAYVLVFFSFFFQSASVTRFFGFPVLLPLNSLHHSFPHQQNHQ